MNRLVKPAVLGIMSFSALATAGYAATEVAERLPHVVTIHEPAPSPDILEPVIDTGDQLLLYTALGSAACIVAGMGAIAAVASAES